MKPLSAIIITYNEEDSIERCIRSLKGIANEIIVVDSLSTDHTQEICNREGVKFVARKFTGYRDQKEYAASLAVNTMILSVDADEEISPLLKQSLLEVLNKEQQYDYYTVNRLNNCCGNWVKHSGLYPDRKIRLYNRNMCSWGGYNIHEIIVPHKGARGNHLEGDLLHYSYNSFEEYTLKADRYSSMCATEYFAAGRRAMPFTAVIHSSWRFFRNYFIRGGIFGGLFGYRICALTARTVYLKYKKLRKLQGQA